MTGSDECSSNRKRKVIHGIDILGQTKLNLLYFLVNQFWIFDDRMIQSKIASLKPGPPNEPSEHQKLYTIVTVYISIWSAPPYIQHYACISDLCRKFYYRFSWNFHNKRKEYGMLAFFVLRIVSTMKICLSL